MRLNPEDETQFWSWINNGYTHSEALQKLLDLKFPYCLCKYDWTDGTAFCQDCGKERKD